jgi:hypothetical protein
VTAMTHVGEGPSTPVMNLVPSSRGKYVPFNDPKV